ncbi:MAG TPA: ATP-binding protein [Candidatus Dormibacteraeota bacterium]|nr:ATP-binding protein [Candidatus Dormibacteraeota bacterium]
MSPGPGQPSAAEPPPSTKGLVRRATPYEIGGLVALYGLAATGLSLAGVSGLVTALALLIGLVVLLAAVAVLSGRDARSVAAENDRRLRQIHDSEAWLRVALDHADIGMGIVDARGAWLHVNDRLRSMLGRSEPDLLALSLPAVTAESYAASITDALAQVASASDGGWKSETLQVRGDGVAIPVALSLTRLGDGPSGTRSLLVQEMDITAAKRAETVREALVAIRHAIATSATWEQAAPAVLSALCTELGWDVAQMWSPDADGKMLKLRQSWQADDPRVVEFDRAARLVAMPAASGLMGKALRSGVPAVNSEVSAQSESLIGEAARRAGLTIAVASPVTFAGDSTAVLALFGRGRRDVDSDVMTMLSVAGSEIGQFIHRSDTTQALQRSEADHRAIFERAPIGIARISAEGELVEGNAALLNMLGHDLETLRNQAWPELQRAYDLAAGRANLAPLLAGISDGGSVQVRAATGDGRWLWLQLSAASIPDLKGRPEHVLLMVEDVTTVRETQDKLEESLAAQQRANSDLEKLDRTKTEFLSIVSHEFRTALTGIQGFSELIRDGGLEQDELRAYGGYIFNDADRVNRLIGDMLDLDRMESGRMSIRMADVDINEVLSDTVARAATASSMVEFKPDLDPRLPIVTGDRDRLIQVVSNLVNNAVKYSPEGGTVTISSRAEGGYALITVADTGLGIPPDEIAHVFERFRRVRSGAAQSIAGTGLGLTIVKQIVEMHGGKIWVESAVGHGSAFHFTIPLAPEAVTPSLQLRHA